MDNDEESITLSPSALNALKEFYDDRDARLKQFENLKAVAEENVANAIEIPLTMDAFAEDWNESQFWYEEGTAKTLAEELLKGVGPEATIGVVSAPSVFIQLKNILVERQIGKEKRPKIYLLEFDRRFEVFPEFVFYDFNEPLNLPSEMKESIDHIICDPPFLSEDCQTKTALTVRWLSRTLVLDSIFGDSRLIVCTGERMEALINKIYRAQGIRTTTFEPKHSKGLSNEFLCYANFECENWKWREQIGS